MKGPTIPVTAQHRQPAAVASKDSCVVPVACGLLLAQPALLGTVAGILYSP